MNRIQNKAFALVNRSFINKILPPYAVLPLILCPIINMVVYNGAQLIAGQRYHYDFTSAWDNLIPLVPAWTLVYLGCFLVWIVNYILVCRESREVCYEFLSAEALSKLICGIFFIFFAHDECASGVGGQ